MPLGYGGSQISAYGGDGYVESYINRRIGAQRTMEYSSRRARKQFEESQKVHKKTSRSATKMRSPRI